MKILYLITGLGGGGAEKVVVDLADQMLLKGHQVKIAYLKGDIILRPKNSKIELIYLNLENIKSIYLAYKNYKKLVECFQPDVVHAHMVHANIFSRISRKFQPIPKLICTAHSNNEGGRLRMLAYKFTHNFSDLTTNVSKSASKKFESLGAVPKGGIKTIYNGINLDKFKYDQYARINLRSKFEIEDDQFLILAIGRLHEAKDYPNLIRAFLIVLKNCHRENVPRLIIVGDGDLRYELEKMIIENSIQQYVTILGRRDDISSLISASDIFVLASKFEGFGLVVAEAMACKCFVVATDCGGVAEVLGNTGILVESQNSEALANGMIKALNMSKDEIKNNNIDARKRIEDIFSLESSVKHWLKIYAND